MNKRSFFCTLLSAVAAAFMVRKIPREMERRDWDGWVKCRADELEWGHIFRFTDDPTTLWSVTHPPSMVFNGDTFHWGMTVEKTSFKVPASWLK